MYRFAVLIALVIGCSKSSDPNATGGSGGDPKAAAGKLTMENMGRIYPGQSTLNDVKQVFGSAGEPTNEEKPGLMPGSKYVWKEDGKKAYVSFGLDGKVNGMSWEGFGGK